jgi:aminobenzoyl-glutamate utilization protein B
MRIRRLSTAVALWLLCAASMCAGTLQPQTADPRLEQLKASVTSEIESMSPMTQQMVDMIFSFSELGFQEFETSRYCIDILRRNGFRIEEGIAGMPTAWMATWGSGKPVIALGSDIDGLPQTSQKPGVAYHAPLIEGAPGHGEGHNSGLPLNITAALALKKVMEREHLQGTLKLWPGVAEEQLAGKAHYVRAGSFNGVDIILFVHVDSAMGVSYGASSTSGLVSVEYTFQGASAHAGGAPWRGRSALDAVELMDVGWNFRREHLRLQQRSHYVITNGGDQPNVVPPVASVWYFFREMDYPHIKELFEIGNTMAQGAAMMTGTSVTWRLLGSAWPTYFNQPVAETMDENIKKLGMPRWTDADQEMAKAVQAEAKAPQKGLETEVTKIGLPVKEEDKKGGGSDDIGDVSWTVPTVTLRYPANIPGLPGHSWLNAVSMATPIAHKGVTAGAKTVAATVVDLLLNPALVEKAWAYFRDVQTRDVKYTSFLGPEDKPALELNRKTMERYRPEMRKLYFDPSRYKTYLEQLGITYPTVRKPQP